MNRLRIAVVGTGHLGRIHTRLIHAVDCVELIGVVDPIAEAREKVAAEFRTASFTHHQEVIDKIDAAIIATPTAYHHQVGLDLLAADKHLLIEKPIAATHAHAEELVAAAEARGLILQVGHVERFNPAFTAVREHLREPKYIDAVRTSGYTFRSTDIGAVLDIMIHDLDLVLELAQSPVVNVQALGASLFGGHEDMAQARLQFASGCVANLSAARCSDEQRRQMQVFTPHNYASIDFAKLVTKRICPNKNVLHGRVDFQNVSTDEREHLKTTLFTEVLPIEEVTVESRNAILDEQHDFISSIRNGHSPRVTGRQAAQVLAVAEQILSKIAHHDWSGAASPQTWPRVVPNDTLPQRKAG